MMSAVTEEKKTDTLEPVDLVNPFMGVDQEGNCLPGPHLPLGLVRLGPNTVPTFTGHPNTGYRTGQSILCFSHTHVSGTGGGGRYGNIGVIPFIGHPTTQLGAYVPLEEKASPGYYRVKLSPGEIEAELTATARTGHHRYTFHDTSENGVCIDLGAVAQVLSGKDQVRMGSTGSSIGGVVDFPTPSEVTGRADFRGGWGHKHAYSVYFYARFSEEPESIMVASAEGLAPKEKEASGAHCKAYALFGDKKQIEVKIGVSFVSIANARASVVREIGEAEFDQTHEGARRVWAEELNTLRVTGGTEEERAVMHTMHMRLLCMPSDLGVDDEFPLWKSGVRHFSDFYCLWDSVRNANSLFSLFKPELHRDMLNCLLDVAEHQGWMPDAWIAHHYAHVQGGGSSAAILFSESAIKGIEGIDYERAWPYVKKDGEVETDDPHQYGRILEDYHELGFIPFDRIHNSASRQIEYAYQDFCIGQLAEHLGKAEEAKTFYKHSEKLWNLWREDKKAFAPKTRDGQWLEPFDPAVDRNMLFAHFYEGCSRQWTLCTHQSFAELIQRMGGNEAFIAYLDAFFEEGRWKGGYWSKESILHTPFLYNYACVPAKTAEISRKCLADNFQNHRDGMGDNEDMGSQSAFMICSAMGLYPVMGQDIYLLSSPIFDAIEMSMGENRHLLKITAEKEFPDAIYVKSLKLNGTDLSRSWVHHREIAKGAHFEYVLSNEPSTWGTAEPPPSPQ